MKNFDELVNEILGYARELNKLTAELTQDNLVMSDIAVMDLICNVAAASIELQKYADGTIEAATALDVFTAMNTLQKKVEAEAAYGDKKRSLTAA